MKAPLLALVLLGSCILSAQAGTGRNLLQDASAPAPSSSSQCQTVAQVAQQAGLTTLLQAAELDSLTDTLSDPELAYTVFAPTDEAFEAALQSLGRDNLTDVLYNSELDPILQYHFIITPYTDEELKSAGSVPTNYRNETLSIGQDGTITAFGNTANITQANIVACQSVVHVIDAVLVPEFVLPDFSAPSEVPSEAPAASY